MRQLIRSREEYLYVDIDNGNSLAIYDKEKLGNGCLFYPKEDKDKLHRYIIAMRLQRHSGLFSFGSADDLVDSVRDLESYVHRYSMNDFVLGSVTDGWVGGYEYGRILFSSEPHDTIVKKD